jgi:hypothetical protein
VKFDEWFDKQFGPDRRCKQTDEQLVEIIRKGHEASEELARRQRRESVRQHALYAWQVKDEDKQ